MDTIRTNNHKQESYILKSNLWKFFKVLRAQANSIYCLLVAADIDCAWVIVVDKLNPTIEKRISIRDFIDCLKKMPSTNKRYRIGFKIFDFNAEGDPNRQTYEAEYRKELGMDIIKSLLPTIVAYHCIEAKKRGLCFELTTETIRHYKFKKRNLDEIRNIVERCNEVISENHH